MWCHKTVNHRYGIFRFFLIEEMSIQLPQSHVQTGYLKKKNIYIYMCVNTNENVILHTTHSMNYI